VGVVLETNREHLLALQLYKQGHSFISPISDFRKTNKTRRKDAFVGCSRWCGSILFLFDKQNYKSVSEYSFILDIPEVIKF
jgi:hypothetical protein